MNDRLRSGLDEHRDVAAAMGALLPAIEAVARILVEALARDGRVLAFGNGGSAADAQHLAAEFVGRMRRERGPLPALALTTDPSTLTALANDYGFPDVFARQIQAHARPGDVVVGITTSGASENVGRGLAAANARGATTVLLAGGDGGPGGSRSGAANPGGTCDHVRRALDRASPIRRRRSIHGVRINYPGTLHPGRPT